MSSSIDLAEAVQRLEAEVTALRKRVQALEGGEDGLSLPQAATFESALSPQGNFPALNSSVTWARKHHWEKPGGTAQLLSLIFEADGQGTFPWPLYIQLTNQAAPGGDATGVYVRLLNAGGGWAAGYHTDLFHVGSGTSIGANLELVRTDKTAGLPGGHYPDFPRQPVGRAIGLNIQNTSHSTASGDQAINIQGGPGHSWDTAVNIQAENEGEDAIKVDGHWVHAIHVQGSGDAALTVEGEYRVGIALGPHDIHLGSGAKIFLDDAGTVFLRFNADTQRLEFVHEPKGVIGYLDLSADAHAL